MFQFLDSNNVGIMSVFPIIFILKHLTQILSVLFLVTVLKLYIYILEAKVVLRIGCLNVRYCNEVEKEMKSRG